MLIVLIMQFEFYTKAFKDLKFSPSTVSLNVCYNFPANAGYALFIKEAERKPDIFYLPFCSPVLVRSSQDLYKHHCLIFRLRSEFGILLFSFISLSTGVDRQEIVGYTTCGNQRLLSVPRFNPRF